MGAAFISASQTDVGFLAQYVLRYMAFSGLIWNLTFFAFSIFISFYTKMKSWNKAHPEIPRWVFFFFIDAADYDMGFSKDRWVLLKVIVAGLCMIFFLMGIIWGVATTSTDSTNGWWYFMAFTVLCYYVLNARQSCKPGGLYALWRDKIPAPSNSFLEEQEYIAHALSIWDKKQNEMEVLKLNDEKNNEDNFIYGKETDNKENENNNDETNGDKNGGNNETRTQQKENETQKEKEKEKDKNGEVKTVALSQPGTTAIEMELIQSQKDDMSKSQSQPQAPATRREKNEQNLQLTFDFWSNRGKSAGVINVPALDRIMSIPLDGVGRGRAGSRGRGSSVNRGRGGTINRNSSLARSGSQLTKQETKFFEAQKPCKQARGFNI